MRIAGRIIKQGLIEQDNFRAFAIYRQESRHAESSCPPGRHGRINHIFNIFFPRVLIRFGSEPRTGKEQNDNGNQGRNAFNHFAACTDSRFLRNQGAEKVSRNKAGNDSCQ